MPAHSSPWMQPKTRTSPSPLPRRRARCRSRCAPRRGSAGPRPSGRRSPSPSALPPSAGDRVLELRRSDPPARRGLLAADRAAAASRRRQTPGRSEREARAAAITTSDRPQPDPAEPAAGRAGTPGARSTARRRPAAADGSRPAIVGRGPSPGDRAASPRRARCAVAWNDSGSTLASSLAAVRDGERRAIRARLQASSPMSCGSRELLEVDAVGAPCWVSSAWMNGCSSRPPA